MLTWCSANCEGERKPGETEEQFLYKTRKKAIGPFKRRLWTLPEESAAEIGANLRAKFGHLFDELGIAGTRELVERHTSGASVSRPLPAALGGADAASVIAGASVFDDDGSGE
jgi:fructose-bisphosphate aldolase class II